MKRLKAKACAEEGEAIEIRSEMLFILHSTPIFLVAAIAVSAGLLAVAGASILSESPRTVKPADES